MRVKKIPIVLPPLPDLTFEHNLWQEGYSHLAGIDEAGRGAWAGPVSAAAVIFHQMNTLPEDLAGLNDSKKLKPHQREKLAIEIKKTAAGWGIGFASSDEVDELGILPATKLAMQRALCSLGDSPEYLLVDYVSLPDNPTPQMALVKGDARSVSIAAASILAKTARDHVMCEQDAMFPGYHWSANKGYGTAAHQQAIQDLGLSPIHRRSFQPVAFFYR
jgi:ribonuclease HII